MDIDIDRNTECELRFAAARWRKNEYQCDLGGEVSTRCAYSVGGKVLTRARGVVPKAESMSCTVCCENCA